MRVQRLDPDHQLHVHRGKQSLQHREGRRSLTAFEPGHHRLVDLGQRGQLTLAQLAQLSLMPYFTAEKGDEASR
ncbi:hypothetical protein Misp05_51730 [Micromonospora sp. NBRC 107095]|nr:hypothetical protein Misp05_51730 [Micromonospora sp. NBRC 107095]